MDGFRLNTVFEDYESTINAKKAYELASNTLLVVSSSKVLYGESDLQRKLKYQSILFVRKAGNEKPTKSNGIRASATYKKGCGVKVSESVRNDIKCITLSRMKMP